MSKTYTGKKEELTYLLKELLNQLNDWRDATEKYIAEMLGIESFEESEELKNNSRFKEIVCNQPQRAVIAYLFESLDWYTEHYEYKRCDFHDPYSGDFRLKENIKLLYDILGYVGYEPSTDEIMLIKGTHPVFKQMSEVTDDEH